MHGDNVSALECNALRCFIIRICVMVSIIFILFLKIIVVATHVSEIAVM